jgi:hypothetical protein
MRILLQRRHNCQQIQTCAKTGFGNRQMIGCRHARWQIIAIQKDMPRLGKPVISIVVAVIKVPRTRHPVSHIDLRYGQIIIGIQMRG